MANKILTAKVRFDTKSAEASLTRLSKKIQAVQNAVNKTSKNNNALNSAIKKATTSTNKLNTAVRKVVTTTNKVVTSTNKVNSANVKATKSAQQMNNTYRNANKSANGLLGTVKRIAGAYLGIQTAQAVMDTSDSITSAKNRFNNLDGGSPEKTAESMDKIYAAAQRSRTGYEDMLSNVSKTMTLAGDSFQGNIDNAIRFQEIMAKAYTVGGASDTEAATSMYQLVQALGSGVLQGDELRSVREGAPLAYKAIEKFAQGVYDTDESLKQLAADGKITSDMVVAAIMDADFSGKLEEQFENTQATFEQTFAKIKNMAMKAFEPVLEKINKLLNSKKGERLIEGIGYALVILGNTLYWVLDIFATFFNWCAENWEWLKYIVTGAILVIIALFVKWAAIAIWNALVNLWSFLTQYWGLLLIVAGVMAILYVYELWRQGTIATTEAIVYCLLIISAMFLIAGIIMMSIPLLIAAVVIAVLALILTFFAEFCGGINVGIQAIVNAWFWMCNLVLGAWNWCVALLKNIGSGIANFFIACFNWICAAGYNAFAGIGNFGMALANAIGAIASNIGTAFSNAWIFAKNTFWEFLASVIDGVSKLEPVINGIAQLLGKEGVDFGALSSSIRGKKESYKEFVSVGDAWNSGMNTFGYKDLGEAWSSGMNTFQYENLGEAWDKGWNTYDVFQDGWASDAYNSGYDWGQGIEDKINDWGSQFQNKDASSYDGLFSDIGNLIDTDKLLGDNALPNVNDPAYDIKGAWDEPSVDELLSGVGDVKDSMDIADDDLEWMRKIAEMEWRNEFTTAEIKVEMNNNNTVYNDRDLDGIVEYLSDTLRSEMTSVANGVHH